MPLKVGSSNPPLPWDIIMDGRLKKALVCLGMGIKLGRLGKRPNWTTNQSILVKIQPKGKLASNVLEATLGPK